MLLFDFVRINNLLSSLKYQICNNLIWTIAHTHLARQNTCEYYTNWKKITPTQYSVDLHVKQEKQILHDNVDTSYYYILLYSR